MAQNVPSMSSISRVPPLFLRSDKPRTPGGPVLVDSAEVSTLTPTWRIPPGTVVVLRTATGRYVMAGHASGDRDTPATITALETADADWDATTIKLTLDGVDLVTVTLGGGDDTDAEVVTALNGNAIFAANAKAAVVSSKVVITSLRAGKEVEMKITHSLADGIGTQSARGTDADYRVLNDFVDLLDPNTGAALSNLGPTLIAAAFKTGGLTWHASVTDEIKNEAYSVLERLGSNFAA